MPAVAFGGFRKVFGSRTAVDGLDLVRASSGAVRLLDGDAYAGRARLRHRLGYLAPLAAYAATLMAVASLALRQSA
jgi:hypothetical protein